MKKEIVLPRGIEIKDGILYFGDRQVYCYGEPYKFAHIPTMCTKFAIRCDKGRLCTTLDIVLPKDGFNESLIWLNGLQTFGDRYLPSAFYTTWKSVEHVLNRFAEELTNQEWSINVDDENYSWDNEKGVFRKYIKIETIDYVWDDEKEEESEE
jgi:hypothetical protein